MFTKQKILNLFGKFQINIFYVPTFGHRLITVTAYLAACWLAAEASAKIEFLSILIFTLAAISRTI